MASTFEIVNAPLRELSVIALHTSGSVYKLSCFYGLCESCPLSGSFDAATLSETGREGLSCWWACWGCWEGGRGAWPGGGCPLESNQEHSR